MGNAVGNKAVGVCYYNEIGVAKEGHKAFVCYQRFAVWRNPKKFNLRDIFWDQREENNTMLTSLHLGKKVLCRSRKKH